MSGRPPGAQRATGATGQGDAHADRESYQRLDHKSQAGGWGVVVMGGGGVD